MLLPKRSSMWPLFQRSEVESVAGWGTGLRQNFDFMSHHFSDPDYGRPQGDVRRDLADVYASHKLDDGNAG